MLIHDRRAARIGRALALGVVVLGVASPLAGCVQPVAGLGAAERWSPTRVAGLEITTGTSGPRPGAADSRLVVVA